MAKPELLLVQLDNVHDSSGSSLVILGLGNGRGSDNVVPGLELRIGKLVGESSCREGYISDKFLYFDVKNDVLVHAIESNSDDDGENDDVD